MAALPEVILFDVYETLLDMTEAEKKINGLLDSKRGYTIWFELFMEYCFVDNCTIQFNDFSSIAKATLKMAAKKVDKSMTDNACDSVVELLKHLPLKENVQEGLSLLNDQNFRIAALTNASEDTVRRRMELTGLISYFEMVLSAEHIKKYKPCCEVYEWAAKKLEVKPEQILMVSSHGWDIAGAANAGLKTAHIKGKEMYYPLAPQPGYVARNIVEIANQLEELKKGTN